MNQSYERIEWVEIIEPRTKEHMYANLTTGECVWDPPKAVPIKRTDSSQWWELFDTNTQRFYYYNAETQRTVWHRPAKCDIIPLAKLQTLKQNTDPSDRKEICTQTSVQLPTLKTQSSFNHAQGEIKTAVGKKADACSLPSSQKIASRNASSSKLKNVTSDLLLNPKVLQISRLMTSPDAPKKDPSCRVEDSVQNNTSGKSSDSSVSSCHSHSRFTVCGNSSTVIEHPSKNLSRKQQITKDSVSTGLDNQKSSVIKHLPYCSEKASQDVTCPTQSSLILESKIKKSPVNDFLKRRHYAQQQLVHIGGSDYGSRNSNKQESGLCRSGSFMSSSIGSGYPASALTGKYYRKPPEATTGANLNRATTSNYTMHEKYFKSVENTPMTRRHQLSSKGSSGIGGSNQFYKESSSDSSAQSSANLQEARIKTRQHRRQTLPSPAHIDTTSAVATQQNRHKDGQNSFDPLNLDSMPFNIKTPISPQLSDVVVRSREMDIMSPRNTATFASMQNFTSSDNICSVLTQSSRGSYDSTRNKNKTIRPNFASLDKQLARRHDSHLDSKKRDKQPKEKNIKKRMQQRGEYSLNQSDVEYEARNTSPLYSNCDKEMQEHLLPIKHYILAQAKLSRLNVFGEPADSESYQSESQSEDSFSGHEPDNEDSDGGSDAHGTYLEHNYGIIDDYSNRAESVAYYAYQYPPYDISEREHMSDNVEAVLESIGDNTECSKYLLQRQDVAKNKPKLKTTSSFHYDTVEPGTAYANQFQHNHFNQLVKAHEQTTSNYLNHPHHGRNEAPTNLRKNSIQQFLQIENADPLKQSQTLPSPNRQITCTYEEDTLDSTNTGPVAGSVKDNSTIKGLNMPFNAKDEQNLKQPTKTVVPEITEKTFIRSSMVKQMFSPLDSNTLVGLNSLTYTKDCDIEKFAADNLNLHSKGIFRKKSSVRDMLSWTAEAITRPMLALSREKTDKKIAIELFKLVQIYMGDRKARIGMSLNSVSMDIICAAFPQHQLRDELYVQLCRQTTENPKRESLIRGWELMAICLRFLPPSPTFQPTLLNYVNRHRDPSFTMAFPDVGKWPIHVQISHYASVCCRRLDRIGSTGRRQAKKPSEEEIELARSQILRNSMFGNTLSEVMELQKDKFPMKQLPWIQTTLSDHVLLLNGKQTEGIFRVSADVDEVSCLKNRLDRWDVPDYNNSLVDAHAPASLLKLWYRELYDPLIPDEFYEECVNTDNPEKAQKIVQRLPELNRLVLSYLIYFLQQFTLPSVVTCTKMDSANLAMVFAPNCLRCRSDDPKVILENARKEMSFIRTLIQYMDTSFVENLV